MIELLTIPFEFLGMKIPFWIVLIIGVPVGICAGRGIMEMWDRFWLF